MDFATRDCVLADADVFKKLHDLVEKQHRAALPARFRRPAAGHAKRLLKAALADRNSKIFVAESEGVIVGYILVRIKKTPSHPILKPNKFLSVEEMAVDPRARRRGVGSRLMKRAEEFAAARGCAELELHVYGFNSSARKFYESLGYGASRTHLSKSISG